MTSASSLFSEAVENFVRYMEGAGLSVEDAKEFSDGDLEELLREEMKLKVTDRHKIKKYLGRTQSSEHSTPDTPCTPDEAEVVASVLSSLRRQQQQQQQKKRSGRQKQIFAELKAVEDFVDAIDVDVPAPVTPVLGSRRTPPASSSRRHQGLHTAGSATRSKSRGTTRRRTPKSAAGGRRSQCPPAVGVGMVVPPPSLCDITKKREEPQVVRHAVSEQRSSETTACHVVTGCEVREREVEVRTVLRHRSDSMEAKPALQRTRATVQRKHSAAGSESSGENFNVAWGSGCASATGNFTLRNLREGDSKACARFGSLLLKAGMTSDTDGESGTCSARTGTTASCFPQSSRPVQSDALVEVAEREETKEPVVAVQEEEEETETAREPPGEEVEEEEEGEDVVLSTSTTSLQRAMLTGSVSKVLACLPPLRSEPSEAPAAEMQEVQELNSTITSGNTQTTEEDYEATGLDKAILSGNVSNVLQYLTEQRCFDEEEDTFTRTLPSGPVETDFSQRHM